MVALDNVMNSFVDDDDIKLITNKFLYEYLCTFPGTNFLFFL